MMKDEYIPNVVSINQLCGLMGVSRSRYYQLLSDGIILPPIYSLESKRGYFTREMAEKNVSVIRNNVGLNGKVCLFYNTNRRAGSSPQKSAKRKQLQHTSIPEKNQYLDVIEGLTCLGLQGVKSSEVASIINKLYPNGTKNEDDGEVLKAVYRAIIKQNTIDNPDR
jgi:hypothetical protein